MNDETLIFHNHMVNLLVQCMRAFRCIKDPGGTYDLTSSLSKLQYLEPFSLHVGPTGDLVLLSSEGAVYDYARILADAIAIYETVNPANTANL